MLKNVKVEMPNKNCEINDFNVGGIPYVYYATEYYRNEAGNPTSKRILIGKKDLETGLLIPNDNYFNLFDMEVIVRKRDNNESK